LSNQTGEVTHRVIAGRYSLDSEIGRGGMGVVWRGEDRVLGREVALKRIGLAPGGASPDLLRAEREAQLAASLNHPNVVAVFDLLVEKDEHWLLMEYVDSRNLSDLVRRHGPLSHDDAARLLGQAADGLAAAHSAGIVHRDVKPSNMLVTSEGRVKLTDFGIARTSQDATLTQTGMVTGSPAYIAPEVASGSPATTASDVWSLGATLYHALTGTPPFDVKDNMVAALYRIVHEDPPRLEDAGWLAPVLEATMARDPDHRWSMAQVRDFLLQGPDSATTQVVPAQAPPTTAPLIGVGAAAAATPETAPAPDIAPTPSADDEPERRPRRRAAGLLVGGAAALVAALLIWLAVGLGDEGDTEQAGSADSSASESPTSEEESPGEGQETAEEPADEPAEEPTTEELTSFATDYVPTAISDPDTSWQMLTPRFQEQSGGREGYDRWWDQFSSAEISNVSVDPDAMTVTYTADYRYTDGRQATDTVTLRLVERGGDLLIAEES
jgi:eukaryotic-like serine/threonine-protein kinase